MGSFNATCAVSRAPISPGSAVRLFYICSNNRTGKLYQRDPDESYDTSNDLMHRGLGCYIYDNFKIVGVPIKATYDDYGLYSASEDDLYVKYNLDCIRNMYAKLELPADATYVRSKERYEIEAELLSFEDITDMIREGILYIEAGPEGKQFVGNFAILEEVYQVLLKSEVNIYDDTLVDNKFINYNLENYIAFKNRILDNNEAELQSKLKTYRELYDKLIGTVQKDGTVLTAENAEEQAYSMATIMRDYDSPYRHEYSKNGTFDPTKVQKFFERDTGTFMDAKALTEVMNQYYENSFALMVLMRYNIELIPAITSGQEYDTLDHGSLLVKIGEALVNKSITENEDSASAFEPSVLVYSIDDLESYFNNHWNTLEKQNGLLACEKYRTMFGDESTTLTFNAAEQLGLAFLFHFVDTNHLPVKFVK